MRPHNLSARLLLLSVTAFVAWMSAITWLAQRDYDATVAKAVAERVGQSEQEADATARHISRSLAYLRGIPVMFRQIHRVERALRRFDARASAALAGEQERRQRWTREPALRDLNRLIAESAKNLNIDVMFILNEAGDCIAASNANSPESMVGTSYKDREYFDQVREGRSGRQYAVGRRTGVPGLYYAAPVLANGRFIGAVGVKMNTASLSFWVEQAHAFVVDEFGVVIMARDRRLDFHAMPEAAVAAKSDAEKISRYKLADLPTLALTPLGDPRHPGLFRLAGEVAPVALASRALEEDPIRVFAMHPVPELASLGADRQRRLAYLAALGMLVIALAAATYYYLARRRQVIAILQASESRFRVLFENSPVAYQSLDRAGGILDVNQRLCEMSGYSRAELVGRPFGDLLAPESRGCFDKIWPRFVTGGVTRDDLVLLRKDGGRVYILGEGRIQLDEKGRFVCTHYVLFDISGRKRAEEALEHLNLTLAKRVEEETAKSLQKERLLIEQARHAAMGEMIGNIAHQWRQPLSSLGLVVQNLRYDFKEGRIGEVEMEDYVTKAMKAIGQMSSTIDDFRDFFKPSRQPERFSPVPAIRSCVELVGASFEAHDIEVGVSGPPELQVIGYPSEFSQVVLNLLANAKDALVERKVVQGRIEISVAASAEGVVIAVADNAGGIEAEHLEKIFDPYFTTKDKGTGIGLYMTRTIVEQHMRGTIRAENTADGARLTVDLPGDLTMDRKP